MADLPNSSSDQPGYEGYVMDAENAAEMARLMVQDHLLTQAMGGPLAEQTNLSQIYHVLDVACGPGGWLLDLVTQYPHIQGVGVDISQLMIEYANSLATLHELSQVQFRVMDVTLPLHFPDNTFDLVNGRIFIGFLSKHQWPSLLQECYRITKPGGIVRFTEAEWGFTNSAAFDTLINFQTLGLYRAGHSFSPHGRTFGNANVLRFLLQRAGFEVMGHRAHVVDYSTGAELHESNVQNALIVCKLLEPFLAQMQLATQKELESLHKQTEEDMLAEDFCAIDYYLTVWARKGAATPPNH